MLDIRAFHHQSIFALVWFGGFLTTTSAANAQMSYEEKEGISSTIAAKIERSINGSRQEGTFFRERVISRLAECGNLFMFMSRHTDLETGKRIADVAEISFQVSKRVSEGIAIDRFNEITETARRSLEEKLATEPTSKSEEEMRSLLENCKSFHKTNGVSDAVTALLPSASGR